MFTAALFTIAKCWKQPKCPLANVWIKNCGSFTQWNTTQLKEKGAPNLCNSMDRTGEHYTKWNKTDNERKIPYDLTYKWNLINKTNKWTKHNYRQGNKEQTDSDQRGAGRSTTGKEGDRSSQGICIKDPRTKTKTEAGWALKVEGGGWVGQGRVIGVKMGTTVIEQKLKINSS